MDTGDHVVVINADKIELTGNKGEDKYAYRHSGYPGGITAVKYKDLMATRPVAAVEKAVRGMLPKNTIGRQMLKKLHVVPGPVHPHAAQAPVVLALGERPAWNGLPAKPEPSAPKPKAKSAAPKPETSAPSPKASTAKPKTTAAKPKAKSAAKKTTAAKPKAKSTTKATTTAKPATKKKTETEG
jgi:hypothetical protein